MHWWNSRPMKGTSPSLPPSASSYWVRGRGVCVADDIMAHDQVRSSMTRWGHTCNFVEAVLPHCHVVSMCYLTLITSENAEQMQEELKQQPSMIERLYGKWGGDNPDEKWCAVCNVYKCLNHSQLLLLTCTWTGLHSRFESTDTILGRSGFIVCPSRDRTWSTRSQSSWTLWRVVT